MLSIFLSCALSSVEPFFPLSFTVSSLFTLLFVYTYDFCFLFSYLYFQQIYTFFNHVCSSVSSSFFSHLYLHLLYLIILFLLLSFDFNVSNQVQVSRECQQISNLWYPFQIGVEPSSCIILIKVIIDSHNFLYKLARSNVSALFRFLSDPIRYDFIFLCLTQVLFRIISIVDERFNLNIHALILVFAYLPFFIIFDLYFFLQFLFQSLFGLILTFLMIEQILPKLILYDILVQQFLLLFAHHFLSQILSFFRSLSIVSIQVQRSCPCKVMGLLQVVLNSQLYRTYH